MSKNNKRSKPQTINLSEEEIVDFMEEMKKDGGYAGIPDDELRVKAIELLFEQYDR